MNRRDFLRAAPVALGALAAGRFPVRAPHVGVLFAGMHPLGVIPGRVWLNGEPVDDVLGRNDLHGWLIRNAEDGVPSYGDHSPTEVLYGEVEYRLMEDSDEARALLREHRENMRAMGLPA